MGYEPKVGLQVNDMMWRGGEGPADHCVGEEWRSSNIVRGRLTEMSAPGAMWPVGYQEYCAGVGPPVFLQPPE